jgi:hypothetical protein
MDSFLERYAPSLLSCFQSPCFCTYANDLGSCLWQSHHLQRCLSRACNCLRTRRTSVFAVGNLSCTLQFADSTFASFIRISHSHLAFAFGIRNFMCDSEIRNLSQGVAVALQYLYLLHVMQPSQTTRSTQFIPRFTKTACTYVYFEHPAQTITATSFLSLR